jgi:peptidoglycan hydrolase-like protein with peptidoglycan-binding domain
MRVITAQGGGDRTSQTGNDFPETGERRLAYGLNWAVSPCVVRFGIVPFASRRRGVMTKHRHEGRTPHVLRVLTLASVLAVVPMVTGFPRLSSPARPHPVQSQRHQVGFLKSSVAVMRAAKQATESVASTPGAPDPITTARAGAVTPVQDVPGGVAVVGVTWPKNAVSADDQFQIRTLTGLAWSQWQTFDVEEADGPDPAEAATATRGTSPYVVTGASKFEVRSLTTDPTAPTAATVQVVDPGTSNADSAQPALGAAAAATAKPAIFTRAAWGANESLRRAAPSYGQVNLGFVHHTVSSNTYTAAQVPAMIRGIYAYHVQSNGWSDIGYNFLIDRFGRTWEGRYGGMDKAVIGAQTLNYNSVSTGVSAIGNFDVATVPQAMTNAFKRIFAWKLSLAGIPATGTVVANGKSFQRISGHRDGFPTTCPGRYLYAKLPEIRAGAAALMGAPASAPVPPVTAPWAVTRYTPYKGVVLQQGSKGAAVVVLQRGVNVTPDGAFGPATRAAIVAFQRQQGTSPTGVANNLVWDRLENRDYPLIASRGLTLKQGSKGPAVVVLQRALRVGADGAFGPMTVAAVKAVQQSAKLTQTGVVSDWTWVAIENRMPR